MAANECMQKVNNGAFQKQVQYFLTKAAIAIINEDAATTHHTERLIFSKGILANTVSLYQFYIGVTTNPTIAATISSGSDVSDTDIEFTVNSLIDAYALAG